MIPIATPSMAQSAQFAPKTSISPPVESAQQSTLHATLTTLPMEAAPLVSQDMRYKMGTVSSANLNPPSPIATQLTQKPENASNAHSASILMLMGSACSRIPIAKLSTWPFLCALSVTRAMIWSITTVKRV